MATLFEYYNTGEDTAEPFWGVYWKAQTFTPSVAHRITSVKLKLYRQGTIGTVTASIRATSDGKPTGGDLCSGSIDGATITTASSGAWYEITLGDGCNLGADIQYAIVLRSSLGDGSNWGKWFAVEVGGYAGGANLYSTSSGEGTWWSTAKDSIFEEWGINAQWFGAATLSGTGTLASIAHIIFAGKALLSGTGTLAAIWERVKATTATSEGEGTLSAIGVRIRTGAATLSGVGTLAAIGVRIKTGVATLSGVGTLAGKGVLIVIGKATLSGIGTLAGIGRLIKIGKATLSGVGTLAVIGYLSAEKLGKATLAGVGTLTGKGNITAIGKATLSGVGTLAGVGSFLRFGAATLSGVGTLSAIGSFLRYGQATLAGVGTLTTAGRLIAIGKATLAGVGTLSAAGRIRAIGQVTLSGVGTLSASAIVYVLHYGSVVFSGVGSLTAVGSIIKTGVVHFSGIGTLIVRAIRIWISPKYTLELRNSDGDLVSILQKAYFVSYSQVINNAHELTFTLPADDDKVAGITLANEIWLRNHRTGVVIKKFKLGREREVRESWL